MYDRKEAEAEGTKRRHQADTVVEAMCILDRRFEIGPCSQLLLVLAVSIG